MGVIFDDILKNFVIRKALCFIMNEFNYFFSAFEADIFIAREMNIVKLIFDWVYFKNYEFIIRGYK